MESRGNSIIENFVNAGQIISANYDIPSRTEQDVDNIKAGILGGGEILTDDAGAVWGLEISVKSIQGEV